MFLSHHTTLIAATAFLTGCISVQVGRLPDLSLLHTRLRPGVSTTDQVVKQLGPPYGRGSLFLPFQDAPRESIYYYYEEGTIQNSHRGFLFVFLSNDRYDGYMWFSNIPHLLPPAPAAYQPTTRATSNPAPSATSRS